MPRAALLLSIATRTVVCLVLLGLSIGIFLLLVATQPQPKPAADAKPRQDVLVMRVVPVSVHRTWSGYGTARAMDAADVPARVTSTVVEVPESTVRGNSVRKGDLLARFDESDFAHELEIAVQNISDLDAQLQRLDVEQRSWTERVRLAEEDSKLARADFERIQVAAEGGAARERELDRARQAVIAAERAESTTREELEKIPSRRLGLQALRAAQQSARDLAQENLERCTVVSPLDGILAEVDVDEGENVAPGTRIARVVSLSRVEVALQLPAAARSGVAVGSPVTLTAEHSTRLDELQTWSGTVARISPVDDPDTRTFPVFVEIRQDSNASDRVTPGRFLEGRVESLGHAQRTIVPRRALSDERLRTVKDGVVGEQSVPVDFYVEGEFPELGLEDRQWVVLRKDLADGTLVVVNAARHLAIGSTVQVSIANDKKSGDLAGGER